MSDHPRLELLIGHESVYLLEDKAEDWRALAATRGLVDRPDSASAALLAIECEVNVMTRDPRWYSAVPERIVHHFDE
ncbi:hypothetical protein Ato02nite_006280 [Paractinoplanes toevensis]|uniref:PIN domain-containing protein n=1 Tax=Paractinoplanes toevensis TaxID=571911 RepID=A0A919W1V2_9ACTN|nr:hypothetical protein Ato02nite_006280 [Actinoplanes toevensis]